MIKLERTWSEFLTKLIPRTIPEEPTFSTESHAPKKTGSGSRYETQIQFILVDYFSNANYYYSFKNGFASLPNEKCKNVLIQVI